LLELNKIYCMDNVTGMKLIDDNSIDLTVTSPPYDNLRDYKSHSWNLEDVVKQLYRITKIGGVVVWVVGDATIKGSESGSSFRQALSFIEYGFNLHDTMIYEKGGIPYPSTNRYNQAFEYMFIFSKGKPNTYNLIKDRKNLWAGSKAHWGKPRWRQKDGSMKEVSDNHIIPEFSIRTNVWRYSIGKGNSTKDSIAYKHPAIFPEQLANDHILSWSNDGDLILDPFVGSVTTTKIAKLLNRSFIGFDTSQEYCDIAEKRIKDL
jgi:DNA modification methylase